MCDIGQLAGHLVIYKQKIILMVAYTGFILMVAYTGFLRNQNPDQSLQAFA